ncbi:hypothetical protein METBIDRAFT_33032 [Metschnikowia bicuspidata var. bicuspidata NRRL YB-4993]|uniref:Flavin reductase like domain-containing protein n=1 Tax=Metschnikowia bicuspidata var. bicuspidata NRRL YB-4993 TaxID=869754 RepID=A0A1A0H830_9ASCO|nr:hypothetical protein METBIDRAFT_33032 [Metschnikowia bicuspidata var. bicuspidata NRRL YB-4993]OBA20053.1 hypothetical protein METBIDRAFT_33032 [Metschnikowia bicuspidata var. bicuspidata NRRL YB-4993]
MTQAKAGLESKVNRNPHPDFARVERQRPSFDKSKKWQYTQIPDVEWKPGSGANSDEWKNYKKISIDPYQEGRSPVDNYKTLISAVVPRPIGFVSTIGENGKKNLAPFSYFTVVNHDPPIFTLGFSGGKGSHKDTCKNILETEELTINIISEWFVEAANFTSINSPLGTDEWKLSGLTPLESQKVKPPHVAESAFSIEAKLVHSHEWESKADPGKATGTLCIVEGVNFHAREDVINEDMNILDIAKLKPVARLGGITYSRTLDGYERLRPDFQKEVEEVDEVNNLL